MYEIRHAVFYIVSGKTNISVTLSKNIRFRCTVIVYIADFLINILL